MGAWPTDRRWNGHVLGGARGTAALRELDRRKLRLPANACALLHQACETAERAWTAAAGTEGIRKRRPGPADSAGAGQSRGAWGMLASLGRDLRQDGLVRNSRSLPV